MTSPAARRKPTQSTPTSRVTLQAGNRSFVGIFNDTPIAKAIAERLPIASTVNRWGDEIYVDIPLKMANTKPTVEVKVGDIAYWPDGPCLCIFFGKTPASKGDEPQPASEVTIVGHTDATPELLRTVMEGTPIRVNMY